MTNLLVFVQQTVDLSISGIIIGLTMLMNILPVTLSTALLVIGYILLFIILIFYIFNLGDEASSLFLSGIILIIMAVIFLLEGKSSEALFSIFISLLVFYSAFNRFG